jgi:hypothetical protein
MAADYQTQVTGGAGTFKVLEDTQVVLEEPALNAYAYVCRDLALEPACVWQERVPLASLQSFIHSHLHPSSQNHYITLFDLHARGYVRPWSISYITQDPNKLMTHFASILSDVQSVSEAIKFANRKKFLVELQQRKADLLYSQCMYVCVGERVRGREGEGERARAAHPPTPSLAQPYCWRRRTARARLLTGAGVSLATWAHTSLPHPQHP